MEAEAGFRPTRALSPKAAIGDVSFKLSTPRISIITAQADNCSTNKGQFKHASLGQYGVNHYNEGINR